MIAQLNPRASLVNRTQWQRYSHWAAVISLGIAVVMSAGCSARQKRAWRHCSEAENYRLALESHSGDERREAVIAIGQSGYYASSDAFGVLDAVARTDAVSQNRCIAIRILSRYKDDRPFGTLLTILQATSGETREERKSLPPDDDVRWEAVATLKNLLQHGTLTEAARHTACDVLLTLLTTDPSRNVRLAVVEALGGIRDARVLQALIRSLRTSDFAMADIAEQSLIALTGTTHSYDADAWEKWLAETNEPFAHAGRPVTTSRPAGPTWWDKQKRAFQRAIKAGGTS